MKINRKITITVEGETEEDVEYAFNEAFLRMVGGCTSGKDSNETSAFWFDNSADTGNPTIYIVLEGGCVCYVSSTDANLTVHVVDRDDIRCCIGGDHYSQNLAESQANLLTAEGLQRIW